MLQRRRAATREELVQVLAGRAPGIDWVVVLEHLAEAGVQVELKIVVAEEV